MCNRTKHAQSENAQGAKGEAGWQLLIAQPLERAHKSGGKGTPNFMQIWVRTEGLNTRFKVANGLVGVSTVPYTVYGHILYGVIRLRV